VPRHPFDLDDCLSRVAAADQDAARALVARCHPLVARIVRSHRPKSHGEDDLVQDVFLKMFVMLPRYEVRDGRPFEAWLSRLAVRTCLDVLRAEARRRDRVPLSRGAQACLETLADERGAGAGDAAAARELVEALLAELPPSDRLALTLRDLEQRSPAEIAAVTGWSVALVRVRVFRARMRLRAAVRRRRKTADG
jgi:RNA polymerase sigma-70 factor (ECF subfamily)